MAGSAVSSHAQLAAWRAQGQDRHDPLAFHYLAALERRAAACDGTARRVLEAKLCDLIKAYADTLAGTPPGAAQTPSTRVASARGPLGVLVDDVAGRAAQRQGDTVMGSSLSVHGRGTT